MIGLLVEIDCASVTSQHACLGLKAAGVPLEVDVQCFLPLPLNGLEHCIAEVQPFGAVEERLSNCSGVLNTHSFRKRATCSPQTTVALFSEMMNRRNTRCSTRHSRSWVWFGLFETWTAKVTRTLALFAEAAA